jgi:hypothetical protein
MSDTFTVKVKIVDDDSNTIHYGRTGDEMVALLSSINPDNLDKLEVNREGSVEETKVEISAWIAKAQTEGGRIGLDAPGVVYPASPDPMNDPKMGPPNPPNPTWNRPFG